MKAPSPHHQRPRPRPPTGPACALALALALASTAAAPSLFGAAPAPPHIDYVEPLDAQPHEADSAVIWFDDFDDDRRQRLYPEGSGETTSEMRLGSAGKAFPQHYPKGKRGTGGRKVFFGDTPTYGNKAVRRGESFDEVYWRIYVKHQAGWTGGGPAKLSRATSLARAGSSTWAQAMIAHVWSSGQSLTLDPASGVRGGRLVTTRYNDFKNLRWLGNKPVSSFRIHAPEEAGRWVCVESRAKLNTPGKKDGENQLWIDGVLQAERKNLDWRGTYTATGINAVFLEAYWNSGSPVDQTRWIDHFVISTRPVGPLVCPRNPAVVAAPYHGPGERRAWEFEVAAGAGGGEVVWRSKTLPGAGADDHSSSRVVIDDGNGRFAGELAGQSALAPGRTYALRARQEAGSPPRWSAWGRWHQAFRTAE